MENKEVFNVFEYFNNTQYKDTDYGMNKKFVIDPVGAESTTNVKLQPYYNPLKKAINTLTVLALKGLEVKDKSINEQWRKDNYYLALPKIFREMLLDKCFVEIIKNTDKTNYAIHKNQFIEVEYNGSEILKFSFEGEVKVWNELNEIETITIKKTYKNKLGKWELELEQGKDDPVVYFLDYVPIHEFSFSQDYSGLLIKIDLVNELISEARAIINLHSSPIKFAKNLGKATTSKQHDETSTETESTNLVAKLFDKLKFETHKKSRTLTVEESTDGKEASLSYIELSNTWINEITSMVELITEQIKSEYPEIELVFTDGQISTTTQIIQLQEIRSKVTLLRDTFLAAQVKLDEVITKNNKLENYTYSDVFEELEQQKELENDKLQADTNLVKANTIQILNGIQTNEELLRLVDEELQKQVENLTNNKSPTL